MRRASRSRLPIAAPETTRQRADGHRRVPVGPETLLGGKAREQQQSVGVGGQTLVSTTLPIRLINPLNERVHWAVRSKRAKEQRGLVKLVLRCEPPPPPVTIVITRIGPRRMDKDGNVASMKHVQDGIADWLGIDDGDERLNWVYRQERGLPKEYAVRIEIYT